MKTRIARGVLLAMVVAPWGSRPVNLPAAEVPWKAGVSAVKITPQKSMWMAGYAARKEPSEGTAQDLFAKCLVLADSQGNRLVLVTMDLLIVPRTTRDWLAEQVQSKHGIAPGSLLMCASHTHCGPELSARINFEVALAERQELCRQYTGQLHEKLLALIDESLKRMEPARLDYQHSRASFAMNRRRPTEKGYINSPNSEGPVDHEVPVLRVMDPAGKDLKAVVFGYACHNTTLSFRQFCGDYAGYAQQYLEEAYPNAKALFVTGCGGDQNPCPRRTIELAQQHGRTLANSVEAALLTVPRPLAGPLRAEIAEVALDYQQPTVEELEKTAAGSKQPEKGHAQRLLQVLREKGKLDANYPYLVQVVRFGMDLVLVALAGEVVVDYSLRLKRELAGPAVWTAGYCNDVFGYTPSRRVLSEGGYEPVSSTLFYSQPGPFAPSIEERIMQTVHALAKKTEATLGP